MERKWLQERERERERERETEKQGTEKMLTGSFWNIERNILKNTDVRMTIMTKKERGHKSWAVLRERTSKIKKMIFKKDRERERESESERERKI